MEQNQREVRKNSSSTKSSKKNSWGWHIGLFIISPPLKLAELILRFTDYLEGKLKRYPLPAALIVTLTFFPKLLFWPDKFSEEFGFPQSLVRLVNVGLWGGIAFFTAPVLGFPALFAAAVVASYLVLYNMVDLMRSDWGGFFQPPGGQVEVDLDEEDYSEGILTSGGDSFEKLQSPGNSNHTSSSTILESKDDAVALTNKPKFKNGDGKDSSCLAKIFCCFPRTEIRERGQGQPVKLDQEEALTEDPSFNNQTRY